VSASEDLRARPTYHELLEEHMEAAGVEDVEDLWEEMPLVLDREIFELMYEGTWPYLDGLFFAAIQDALSLEDDEIGALCGAFIFHNLAKPHFLREDPPDARESEQIRWEQHAEYELRAAVRRVAEDDAG
jgi:hypothetical protein